MTSTKIPIYGFSFLKNGVSFDYPFYEALSSLTSLCDQSYLALGANDDGTSLIVKDIAKLKIIPTIWDQNMMGDGGKIFSFQSNIALQELRKNHQYQENAWAIYLQGDEVFHNFDFNLIREEISNANTAGFDAISFRYFHFWKSHYQVAINSRWYPHEVRAIKVNSNIESYGDAQGFCGMKKIFYSDIHVLHYGHARNEEKKKQKQDFLLRSIRKLDKFKKYKIKEQKAFAKTKTIPFLTTHPYFMKNRIERFGEIFDLKSIKKDVIYIVGDKKKYQTSKKILADNIVWTSNVSNVPKKLRKHSMVILDPNFIEKMLYRSLVPKQMESKLAKPWPNDIYLDLKLAEKGVVSFRE